MLEGMTIGEVIDRLQRIKEAHGDLPLCTTEGAFGSICYEAREGGKVRIGSEASDMSKVDNICVEIDYI